MPDQPRPVSPIDVLRRQVIAVQQAMTALDDVQLLRQVCAPQIEAILAQLDALAVGVRPRPQPQRPALDTFDGPELHVNEAGDISVRPTVEE